MSEVTIRRAREDEIKNVQQLNSELLAEVAPESWAPLDPEWSFSEDGVRYFEGVISGERGICFVAEIDGALAGYVAGHVRQPVPYRPIRRSELENMYVQKDKRKHGAGSKLVDAFVQWSREQGAKRCMVDTYAVSKEGKKFYEDHGFSSDTVDMEMPL
jgi:GNAT superfamily N-acetyltransferase